MARMTEAQLKKLTPAERKAREKRLAYNREYDKKKNKSAKKSPAKKPATRASVATKQREVNSSSEKVEMLKSLANELDAIYAREAELLQQMRELLA